MLITGTVGGLIGGCEGLCFISSGSTGSWIDVTVVVSESCTIMLLLVVTAMDTGVA